MALVGESTKKAVSSAYTRSVKRSRPTVTPLSGVDEIDEFAFFPLPYLRKFQK